MTRYSIHSIVIPLVLSLYVATINDSERITFAMNSQNTKLETATFAGGCFWCMEPPFEKLRGVTSVISGYTGGNYPNPTYSDVTSGATGHYEAIQVLFNPLEITYEELLDVFWRQIDPTDGGGSFVDRGSQYNSAVFYNNEDQKKSAEESKAELEKGQRFKDPVVTKIIQLDTFYRAEEYHQDYYKKNPLRYRFYRASSGRDAFISTAWRKDSKNSKQANLDIRQKLSSIQYHVTRENGTERPFKNEYWDNKKEGIYVEIISGEPLFSSRKKYDSGTGWPSFTSPINKKNIREIKDSSLFMERTEVRSREGDSHLGHVFTDGPSPGGLRYCINSAALRFIPKESLKAEGYEEQLLLFK